jgi:signal transduction histidine kinase
MDALDQALADARSAVMALRASPRSRSSLQSVLETYVDDYGDRFGLPTAFESGSPLPPLPPRTEAELLRIVQEALNNVRKHADATLVRVQAEHRGRFVRLAVTDNGRGFEPDAVGEGGFGLTSMRERAELVGGRLEIRSGRSDGTEVVVEVPADRRVAT